MPDLATSIFSDFSAVQVPRNGFLKRIGFQLLYGFEI